jgi:hypothetical protein
MLTFKDTRHGLLCNELRNVRCLKRKSAEQFRKAFYEGNLPKDLCDDLADGKSVLLENYEGFYIGRKPRSQNKNRRKSEEGYAQNFKRLYIDNNLYNTTDTTFIL